MPAVLVANNLPGALKRLKREFASEIRPVLKRHAAHVGPGERRRFKARRARKAAARREAKRAVREAGA